MCSDADVWSLQERLFEQLTPLLNQALLQTGKPQAATLRWLSVFGKFPAHVPAEHSQHRKCTSEAHASRSVALLDTIKLNNLFAQAAGVQG